MRIGFVVLIAFIATTARAADWKLIPDQTHHVQLTDSDQSPQQSSELAIQTTGHDPYLVGRWKTAPTADDHILEFEYFSTTGIEDFSVIVGPPINEAERIQLPPVMIAEGWQTYRANLVDIRNKPLKKSSKLLRIDMGSKPDALIRIRNVRLRPATPTEIDAAKRREQIRQQKIADAKQLRDYMQQRHDDVITNISVDKKHVWLTIAHPKSETLSGLFELLEFRPETSPTGGGKQVVARAAHTDGEWKMAVPRKDGDYDRLTSGWRLKRNGTQTPRRFADHVQPARDDFAPKRHQPRNQKGLSGLSHRGPRTDFPELGVSSVTVNVSLTPFVSYQAGRNRVRIPAPGPPVYFNPAPFAHYDQSMDFARKHDMVVSAIVLIPTSKTKTRSVLEHPETDGGTYAMADLTTARGVAVYAYVLNEIAKRYRNHQRSPGGITNWIAHNEIDFHTVWTNMGRQPRELVMETYYRSMRMIDLIARQHNPHARVFASLTHHFNVADDGRWQRLAPRELLETLQRYSNIEGDFDWGVAYHPYPESLFAKVAWEDKKVSDDLDTPLITLQNLEVLGRFLEQPSMRNQAGDVRGVLLSEQGFHTDSYSDESQNRQAGSLWWTMQKVRQMPWIESFIYHRWIDHPKEGGLMLGLRTLPSKQDPSGKRKRSWYLYQAIGTDREAAIAKGLPGPK